MEGNINKPISETKEFSVSDNEVKIKKSENTESPKRPKKSSTKFFLVFLGIILLGVVGYQVWERYGSQNAKEVKKYKDFFKALESGEEKHKEDKFGGATPEETISMFIKAVESHDFNLAVKYFTLDDLGNLDPEWLTAIKKADEDGSLESIITELKNAKYDPETSLSETDVNFASRDSKGIVILQCNLVKDKFSNIWKIDSL